MRLGKGACSCSYREFITRSAHEERRQAKYQEEQELAVAVIVITYLKDGDLDESEMLLVFHVTVF